MSNIKSNTKLHARMVSDIFDTLCRNFELKLNNGSYKKYYNQGSTGDDFPAGAGKDFAVGDGEGCLCRGWRCSISTYLRF